VGCAKIWCTRRLDTLRPLEDGARAQKQVRNLVLAFWSVRIIGCVL